MFFWFMLISWSRKEDVYSFVVWFNEDRTPPMQLSPSHSWTRKNKTLQTQEASGNDQSKHENGRGHSGIGLLYSNVPNVPL